MTRVEYDTRGDTPDMSFDEFIQDILNKHMNSDVYSPEEINLVKLTEKVQEDSLPGRIAISIVFTHSEYKEDTKEVSPFE